MALKTIRTDDISGVELGSDVEPTTFSYQGVVYELDLGDESLQALETALSPFIRAALAARPRPLVAPDVIRDWARSQGMQINPRGRLSSAAIEAYNDAHGQPPTTPAQ